MAPRASKFARISDRRSPNSCRCRPVCFQSSAKAPRKIHRDGYAEVDKAYYSVPPEYVRRKSLGAWDAKIVRLFNERMEAIAVHVRQEPGKFKTDPAHIHDHKRTLIERGAQWILDRCRLLGQEAGTWAEGLYQQRGLKVCACYRGSWHWPRTSRPAARPSLPVGLTHGAWHLRDLRELLARPVVQEQFAFIETHPLIRDLEAYDNLCRSVLARPPKRQPQPSIDYL